MNEDENTILEFLRSSPESAFGRKEIARKAASRALYEENPRWADAPLNALVDKKLIVMNDSGHFQFNSSP